MESQPSWPDPKPIRIVGVFMVQAPSSASLRPASADARWRCARVRRPTTGPGSGLASADGPGLDGSRETLKEPLQCLSGRATGPPALERFQDDSPASRGCPTEESRDVSFPAPSASGEFPGRVGQRDEGFACRVDHLNLP